MTDSLECIVFDSLINRPIGIHGFMSAIGKTAVQNDNRKYLNRDVTLDAAAFQTIIEPNQTQNIVDRLAFLDRARALETEKFCVLAQTQNGNIKEEFESVGNLIAYYLGFRKNKEGYKKGMEKDAEERQKAIAARLDSMMPDIKTWISYSIIKNLEVSSTTKSDNTLKKELREIESLDSLSQYKARYGIFSRDIIGIGNVERVSQLYGVQHIPLRESDTLKKLFLEEEQTHSHRYFLMDKTLYRKIMFSLRLLKAQHSHSILDFADAIKLTAKQIAAKNGEHHMYVVDDEEVNFDLIKDAITDEFPNAHMGVGRTLEEVRAHIATEEARNTDVILLDLKLSNPNPDSANKSDAVPEGITILREIREKPTLLDRRVVVTSQDTSRKFETFEFGAYDFVDRTMTPETRPLKHIEETIRAIKLCLLESTIPQDRYFKVVVGPCTSGKQHTLKTITLISTHFEF